MLRYFRLYRHFLIFSFSRALEFRVDFVFRIVMDVFYYIINLLFFTFIHDHTDLLGGWTLDQIYLFVCGFLLIDAIHMTVFSNNMWWLPQLINHGDLDYYLVRPVSSLFFLSVREFAANSFMNLLIAIGLMVWAIARFPGGLAAGAVAVFILMLIAGAYLYYLLHMIFLIPVFWLHSHRGLAELFYNIAKLLERPHQIYRGWVRILLVSLLPFSVIASFPAEALFSGLPATRLLHVAVVVIITNLAMVAFWRRGLIAYSSASS